MPKRWKGYIVLLVVFQKKIALICFSALHTFREDIYIILYSAQILGPSIVFNENLPHQINTRKSIIIR